MSLKPKIFIRVGTQRQQAVGIMGRANVELEFNGSSFVKLSNIEIRKSKAGNWWIKYPSEESVTKKDENGYPVRYPHYVLFPGESGKANRDKLHAKIIEDCKSQIQDSDEDINRKPVVSQSPPPQAPPKNEQSSEDDDLEWDLD
jgi:hypothetical protein